MNSGFYHQLENNSGFQVPTRKSKIFKISCLELGSSESRNPGFSNPGSEQICRNKNSK